jgi:hypothetical protein
MLRRNALKRSADLLEHRKGMDFIDQARTTEIHFALERRKVHSVERFAALSEGNHDVAMAFISQLQEMLQVDWGLTSGRRDNETVYERNPDVQGLMGAFGYSYLADKLGEEQTSALRLRRHAGNGGQYAYEALNFVDGRRTVSDIRDWLTAELGPVPLELVEEYLGALESIGVIRRKAD